MAYRPRKMLTKKEAERLFRQEVMPVLRAAYEQDGVPDYVARRTEWYDFTDALCKEGRITQRQADGWALPRLCEAPKREAWS